MKTIRIIPRLDIKGPNLVKGIHLEGLRVLGDPSEYAQFYYENGADELIYMDVVASLYERNSLHDLIEETARKVSIPLLIGGGLRTVEDITKVLRAGADRVSINTAAIKNPEFVKEAVVKFGSSTIVAAVEAIKEADGRYLCYTDNGREYTGKEVLSWVKELESLGVGEIMITSVDKEGTGNGFDQELVKMVTEAVSIPVIAHGGCGKISDAIDVVQKSGADAVAIASCFHYDLITKKKNSGKSSDKEGNTAFLKSGRGFAKVENASINDVKNAYKNENISCRI